MSERRFDIIFNGSVNEGCDPADVKAKLKTLFKLDDRALNQLFSGASTPIKRNIDRKTALQYQTAMNNAGAKIQIVRHTNNQQLNTPAHSEPSANKELSASKEPSANEQPLASTQTVSTASNDTLSLSPKDADLLQANEKRQVPQANIQTNHITLEEQSQSNPFLDALERTDNPSINDSSRNDQQANYPVPDIANAPELNFLSEQDIDTAIDTGKQQLQQLIEQANNQYQLDVSLNDIGHDLLNEHEKVVREKVDIDTSQLNIVEDKNH